MVEINLLDKYPWSERPIEERGRRKLPHGGWLLPKSGELDPADILVEYRLLDVACQFGKEYFDGDRLDGYGGYVYNPRFWIGTVKRFSEYYHLEEAASVLDVGCAKGFMMHDFKKIMPKITIVGIDISQYAYEHAIDDMKPFIRIGNAKELPYPDNCFDLVVSINTIDHLPLHECKMALHEIQRVTKKFSFVTVNAWRNDKERELLQKWNLTALTYMHVDEWKKLFEEVGYTGDYYWFIPS
ncbi:class I SAM-dependent methyltransferase [Methanospirillum sp.]